MKVFTGIMWMLFLFLTPVALVAASIALVATHYNFSKPALIDTINKGESDKPLW